MRRLAASLLALLFPLLVLAAEPGTELVLVLDNSGSMITSVQTNSGVVPPADPLRQSVLGAMVVEGLTRDTDDALTVLSFDRSAPDKTQVVTGYAGLRNLEEGGGTFFLGPLGRARSILDSSSRADRILVFLSDGAPNDYTDPRRGPEVLGLDRADVPFDTLIIGLLPPGPMAEQARGYLRPLALRDRDWVEVQDGNDLVTHFTEAYARSLGSKALTGTLSTGQSRTVHVGRYVTEVMVITASTRPQGPYDATFTGPDGAIPVKAEGDNGCELTYSKAPDLCSPPRMHFQVWRTPHDPLTRSDYTLSVDRSRDDVVYGVILRYDLTAHLDLPPQVRVSDEVPIDAHLLWREQLFDDPEFFDTDGVEVLARIEGQEIHLQRQPDGRFTGTWVPAHPTNGKPIVAEAVFRNTWMEKSTTADVLVDGFLDLELRPEPAVLDFGSWRSRRTATERCLELDLTGSTNADRIPLDIQFSGIPGEAILTFTPLDMAEAGSAREGRQPLRWEACVRTPACAGDIQTTADTAVILRGDHPHYHPDAVNVPVRFTVDGASFLRCWWPVLVLIAGLLFLMWLLVGFVRPRDFDSGTTVKVAGSERQLRRAASLVLREQPKGRRGFYRNARVSITASGDFVAAPRRAVLWVEAARAGETVLHLRGPVERQDRRTRTWVEVTEEEALDGVRTNITYRIGETYLLFQ